MDVSIITPVYNEEDNIQPFFKELCQVIDSQNYETEIIAVDDGSDDSSPEKLEQEAFRNDIVKVISLKENHGQSKALQAGIDRSKGETVVTIDSDMQNDPRDIPLIIKELDKTDRDAISGLRDERKDSVRKKFLSAVASKMRKIMFENDIRDYGCTLKAFDRKAVETLSLHDGMHRYIPVLLEKEGLGISEVEVNHRERNAGKSKYGLRRLPKGFVDMIDLWIDKKFGRNILPGSMRKTDYRIEKVIE